MTTAALTPALVTATARSIATPIVAPARNGRTPQSVTPTFVTETLELAACLGCIAVVFALTIGLLYCL